MPLADKIMELRKKQGWSQIDLADRLDVSRQSVSKWEMAQAVPELDKIIKMSELFAVTTDYLLKDDIPAPDPGAAPPPTPEQPPRRSPEPEKEPSPAGKSRKKRPWVLAACLALAVVLAVLAAADYLGEGRHANGLSGPLAATPVPPPTPVGGAAGEEPVTEEPVTWLEAVSDPDAPGSEMSEYAYEDGAVTGGGVDPAALAAIAAEYASYGITCEDGQWYFEGMPIRVLTDILTSNGESLTGGNFQGTIRNFAGEGDIDVRTVRDFNHHDEHGNGTLLCVETCPVHGDGVWTEYHAEEHHEEGHHGLAD